MQLVTLCVTIIVMILYICLGGVGFHYIEREQEAETKIQISAIQKSFLSKYSTLSLIIMLVIGIKI